MLTPNHWTLLCPTQMLRALASGSNNLVGQSGRSPNLEQVSYADVIAFANSKQSAEEVVGVPGLHDRPLEGPERQTA